MNLTWLKKQGACVLRVSDGMILFKLENQRGFVDRRGRVFMVNKDKKHFLDKLS